MCEPSAAGCFTSTVLYTIFIRCICILRSGGRFTVIILYLPHIDVDFAILNAISWVLRSRMSCVVCPRHLTHSRNSLGRCRHRRRRHYALTKRILTQMCIYKCQCHSQTRMPFTSAEYISLIFFHVSFIFFFFYFFICCALPVFISAFSLPPSPSSPPPSSSPSTLPLIHNNM